MSRVSLRAALLCVAAAAYPIAAADDVILIWNDAVLKAISQTRMAPPMAARALAIVHTAAYDAWAAYDSVAVGTRLGGSLRRPEAERTAPNKNEAISHAAYLAAVDLFPSQEAAFQSVLASLGYAVAKQAPDPTSPAGVGLAASRAVLEYRHKDGSNQLGDLNPGPYSDYTGFRTPNTAETLTEPGKWQPLRNAAGQAQTFLAPHWDRVLPFALPSASEFRPGPPPILGTELFIQSSDDVLKLSERLTDKQKMIAEYWEDGAGTETPPGHWQRIAQYVSRRKAHSVDDRVKLFFALSNGVMDASIAVWECKVFYNCVRPISSIRSLFRNQPIRTWGGAGGTMRTISGDNWQPYLATPPFAEYVSGHSTFSAVSADILRRFFGSDDLQMHADFAAGSSRIEPGAVPANPIRLYWATFSDAADEAGLSRRYGGIHYEEGDIRGRVMGRMIGAAVWQRYQALVSGTAPE